MRYDELIGCSVVVWGAGREGRAAYDELERRGIPASIAVTGGGEVPSDLASLTSPSGVLIAVAGDAAIERLAAADVVVKSPGIAHTDPTYLDLIARGVRVTTLTDLWLHERADRVIGVTGTKGKSTTAALIDHLLRSAEVTSTLVGNGGVPVTVGDDGTTAVAVTEVSSYQAADLTTSPRVAVVTSLYPEHLPWHGSYEQYVADKLNLVAKGAASVVIPNRDSVVGRAVLERLPPATPVRTPADLGIEASDQALTWDGVGALPANQIPLRGRHNMVNATLALTAVVEFLGRDAVDASALLAAVAGFTPLTHRLERVPSTDGREWIDDGLATAPEAVVAGLESFAAARVVLLVGGFDRGLAFEPLIAYLADRSPEVPVTAIAVGPAGARLAREAGDRVPGIRVAPSFATALDWARTESPNTDVVMLSPGAPSFDEFVDYEARSAAFREAAARA
ncbi:MAG TPA: UDP-N-acetylmuramoyl-L-alanine--D-glutamate ligase [Candidatus Lumbricidophila sp.]|nr:UDP-N-acetylmuramoyl-L-alanine--D-glutamate ligase [Candidatus Lumbricidophila sp.]